MPLEVEQPAHLVRPDLTDPITWASVAPLHCEWLRLVAPQLGLDTEKLILGNALSNIIGDDANSFGLKAAFLPEFTEDSKTSIFIRMDWESELPELPENIRNQIRKIRQQLDASDWHGRENFERVRNIWVKGVCNFTRRQIALNEDLRDALKYDDEVNPLWSPYWEDFLYGYRIER